MRVPPLTPPGPRRAGSAWRACLAAARSALRVLTVVLLLAAVAAGMLFVRLSQGPLAVPGAAEIAETLLNREMREARVEIGGAVVVLGAAGEPSGLWFRDVRIADQRGEPLIAAPRVVGHLDLADLLVGRLRPVAVDLVEPRAQVLRAADGRIRVALTGGEGLVMNPAGPEEGEDATPPPAAMDTVAAIMDGFAGDAEPVPGLERLETVRILDATLTYVDERTGRRWRTRGSDLVLERVEGGARAEMRASLTDDHDAETRIAVAAEHFAGDPLTTVVARFANLQADDLAEQIAELGWVRLLDAPMSGGFTFAVSSDGRLIRLDGGVTARDGRILGIEGPGSRFDRARLRVSWDPELRRMAVERLEIAGPDGRAALTGHVSPEGADPFAPDAVTAKLTLLSAEARLPGVFAGPLAFDSGALAARARFDPLRIEIAEARVGAGDMVLSGSGQARRGGEAGWTLDMRVEGREITTEDLLRHWPLDAAANARRWLSENLLSGRVPEVLGEMRLAEGAEPSIGLSFRFRDLVTRYLDDMTPIREARGRGQLTFNEVFLQVEEAVIAPDPDRPIRFGGSEIVVTDLWAPVTPAEIRIRAQGATAEALALLDEPPLGLVGKLGLDPRQVGGAADISARLDFPLVDDLPIEEVRVEAGAILREVDLSLPLGEGEARRVRSERLRLDGTTERMTIAGPVSVDGVPLDVRWTERFSGADEGRELTATGTLGPETLARAGLSLPAFRAGTAAVTASVVDGPRGTRFALDADLASAALGVEAIRWEKARGGPGRFVLEGRQGADGGLDVSRLALEGGGLSLSGSLALGPDRALEQARIERLLLADRADLRGTVTPGAEGAVRIAIEGPLLDLSDFLTDPPDSSPPRGAPLVLDAEIERLVLTPKLHVSPARASLTRDAEGRISLSLSGSAAGRAPFEGSYSRSESRPGTMRVTSGDAGALLSGLGLFEGGRGGTLALDAEFAEGSGTDLRGRAVIENLTVRDARTFGVILERGGVEEAAQAVETGGLRFGSVEIPFSYADGLLRLRNAIARSPALALKVDGTVDERRDAIDLIGVATPAYGLTGALDRIPLLGPLLTGGRGEGLFAMTFQVGGTLAEPTVSVNPLSLLAPGVLRNLFERRASRPSEEFMKGLEAP